MIFHKFASEKNFIIISDNDPMAPATYKPARKNTVMSANATIIANTTAGAKELGLLKCFWQGLLI
tara:strand:- start:419 stop:613 length:195 start_codon:yes stop_codon:yes gene_type:complete